MYQFPIGKNVSVGHGAIIHGATVEDNCLIGMHATVMNGAIIKKGSIVGANALVKTDMKVPENSLIVGIPGRIIKKDKQFSEMALKNARTYQKTSKDHLKKKYSFYKK